MFKDSAGPAFERPNADRILALIGPQPLFELAWPHGVAFARFVHQDLYFGEEATFLVQFFEAARRRFEQRAGLHYDGSRQAARVEAGSLLAQFAMYWRLGEAFLGGVGTIVGFLALRLYSRPQPIGALGTDQLQVSLDLTNYAGSVLTNISATFFSLGSILFFYVFLKSRYIPRLLSGFGVFASIIVTIMLFGNLIFPGHAAMLQYGWAPMAIAEVTTGFWLMFAVKIPAQSDEPSRERAPIPD